MARTTNEERIRRLDEKIAELELKLAELQETREKLLHPVSMRAVLAAAKEAGLTPMEIAEILGLEV